MVYGWFAFRTVSCTAAFLGALAIPAPAVAALREGALSNDTDDKTDPKAPKKDASSSAPKASPISIGTPYGLVVPLYAPQFLAVEGRRVTRVRDSDRGDYFLPGIFVLPSVALYSNGVIYKRRDVVEGKIQESLVSRGYTLSAIIPAGLTMKANDGKDLAIGIGLALGWTAGSGAEVGFALAAVWQNAGYLSKAQQASLDAGAELATNASDKLETRLRPSLCLGIYLNPTF